MKSTFDGCDTGTTAACVRYEALSPYGVLRLALHGVAPPRHAADAAVALMRADALLDALDAWTGLDADWRWIGEAAEPASTAAARAHAFEPGAGDGEPPRATLELPWALLRSLPAPPASLQERLRWTAVPAVLTVSWLALTVDERRALEPGGAVLLPESLGEVWGGTLRAAAELAASGGGVPLTIHLPQPPRLPGRGERPAPLPAPLPATTTADGEALCEVRLASARDLGADRLAGWAAGELPEVGTRASLWRCGGAGGGARCLASGHLIPWGDGWALLLETVADGEEALDPQTQPLERVVR
jgi:hypothetical protein